MRMKILLGAAVAAHQTEENNMPAASNILSVRLRD